MASSPDRWALAPEPVLDYHLHFWTHDDSSVWYRLDQIAAYCEAAATQGVHELALTEHAHRFTDVTSAVGPFWLRQGHEPTANHMADYFDFHARNSLEDYVILALKAKEEGLPVKVGLEVDYYRGQMAEVADVLGQYPFDVLLGSVHWLGTWSLDDVGSDVAMNEWRHRSVDDVWRDYTEALVELAQSDTVDVLAHPDLCKVAGFRPDDPTEYWDMMAEAAATVDISVEVSSAGWNKPGAEQYPAEGLLDRFVARGLSFTTASDAHRHSRVAERHDELAEFLRARGVTQLASYDRRVRSMTPLAVD